MEVRPIDTTATISTTATSATSAAAAAAAAATTTTTTTTTTSYLRPDNNKTEIYEMSGYNKVENLKYSTRCSRNCTTFDE